MGDLRQVTASTLPSGAVKFLLTDVEGSTALWEQSAESMDREVAASSANVVSVWCREMWSGPARR